MNDLSVDCSNDPKDEVSVCALVDVVKNDDSVEDIEVGWAVSSSVVIRFVLGDAAVSREKL